MPFARLEGKNRQFCGGLHLLADLELSFGASLIALSQIYFQGHALMRHFGPPFDPSELALSKHCMLQFVSVIVSNHLKFILNVTVICLLKVISCLLENSASEPKKYSIVGLFTFRLK